MSPDQEWLNLMYLFNKHLAYLELEAFERGEWIDYPKQSFFMAVELVRDVSSNTQA